MSTDVQRLVALTTALQAHARRLTRKRCAERGITSRQLEVLQHLEAAGALTCSRLCERLVTKNSTLTGILDRMVVAELVRRRRGTTDRRLCNVELTPLGARLAHEISSSTTDVLHDALASLPATDRSRLVDVISQLTTHITQAIHQELSEVSI